MESLFLSIVGAIAAVMTWKSIDQEFVERSILTIIFTVVSAVYFALYLASVFNPGPIT